MEREQQLHTRATGDLEQVLCKLLLSSGPLLLMTNSPGGGWQVLREHGDVSAGSP